MNNSKKYFLISLESVNVFISILRNDISDAIALDSIILGKIKPLENDKF